MEKMHQQTALCVAGVPGAGEASPVRRTWQVGLADSRTDGEQAERIDESLLLQRARGTAVAACYLQYHRVAADTARRVLLTLPHRRSAAAPALLLPDGAAFMA